MKLLTKTLLGLALMGSLTGLMPPPTANAATQAVSRELPFSSAVRVGDTLYTAGQIGVDGSDQLVAGGIVPQTRQALDNIKSVIEGNGLSLSDVAKCTVFLVDFSEFSAFNDVYRNFFSKPYPARSTVAVSALAADSRVEIECIAVKRNT